MTNFPNLSLSQHQVNNPCKASDQLRSDANVFKARKKDNSDFIRDVEDFVYYIRRENQAVASLNMHSTTKMGNAIFSRYYFALKSMIEAVCLLPTKYVYSVSVEVFICACLEQGVIRQDVEGKRYAELGQFENLDDVQSYDAYVQFVNAIGAICRTPNIHKKLINALKLREYREESFTKFVDDLFIVHSRIIVLRVDLYYRREIKDLIDAADALDDLDRFVSNMRHNSIFDDLIGSIFKVEFGVDRGVHIHSIFFFNGAIRNGLFHVQYAKEIGEYWKLHVTHGKGDYWNVNSKIRDFEAKGICGIGPIHFLDDHLIKNLNDIVVRYVCKESQSIRLKAAPARKMIRKSQAPEVLAVKRGRPRIVRTISVE